MTYCKLMIVAAFLVTGSVSPAWSKHQGSPREPAPQAGSGKPQTFTQEGISVEFRIDSIPSAGESNPQLIAGTEATVSFKIYDSGRAALSNLRPAVWIDRRTSPQPTGPKECREKIQSFLQPGFSRRPEIDLNAYFILALNHEPNISVIDPLFGFGGSKLYALVELPGAGEDWVMSTDKKTLYVTVPGANQVAVIDTVKWKIIANINAGVKPVRIALQPDEKYLWIGNDGNDPGSSGVTVIDTGTLKVAARIETGAGHHEIAFSEDDRLSFVTNKQGGTLSVIDVRKLSRIADIKVGALPVALAFSNISKTVYVANEGDGEIAVIDPQRLQIIARMKAEPGLRTLRMLPDSRFGFVVNQAANRVYIFDVSNNRLRHSLPVGPGADQITFTREFAYVRASGDEFVNMIKLSDLDKTQEVAISRFPAGQKAPRDSPTSSVADAIVPAPGGGSVLVANPADKMIYYYTEGMAAPMGTLQNYRRAPKALLVLDKSVSETRRGVYTSPIRLPDVSGQYDVAFLLDSPRLTHCFVFDVAENPALAKPSAVPIAIEPLLIEPTAHVGEPYKLRFKVLDKTSGEPKNNLDVGVLVFLAPGIWQQRAWTATAGNGIYEMTFVPPQAGMYYVYFQSPSLGVTFNQITPLTLSAVKR